MLVLRNRKARKTRARKTECGSRRFRCRWVIIITTITTITTAVSSFASGLVTPAIITTITTTIIITTEAMERGVLPDAPLLFSFTGFSFADLAFCRTEQMAVRAVEDGVGFRGPR
jgi:hypothetical protein